MGRRMKMDAVEYLIEKRRATGNCNGACSQCIISSYKNGIGCSCNDPELRYPEKAVEIVEKWAAVHPKKTRQSEFLKMFPNARIRGDVLEIRPCDIDDNIECIDRDEECYECYRKYWLAEVE